MKGHFFFFNLSTYSINTHQVFDYFREYKFSDQVENTELIPSKYAYVGNLYPFALVDNELFTFKLKTIRRKQFRKERNTFIFNKKIDTFGEQ